MVFEKGLRNKMVIRANSNGEKLHFVNCSINFSQKNYDYNNSQKFKKFVSKEFLRKYNILEILEQHLDEFGLVGFNPNDAAKNGYNGFEQLYAAITGNLPDIWGDIDEVVEYYNCANIILIALFDELSKKFDGYFDMSDAIYDGPQIQFYFDEDKLKAYDVENFLHNIFDEFLNFDKNNYMEVCWGQELLQPCKFSHEDYFGNEIKIGDIGIGCFGRGRTSGLCKTQVLSMTKVFINGDLRPDNFVVLVPIDGRQIKGV